MLNDTSKHLLRASSAKLLASLIAVVLVIAGLFGGVARAQLAGTGAIAGSVQDPSGAVVAKATITATNTDTNVSTTRTTTGAGDYNITPLLPGPYTVTVAAPGFEGYKQENVTVDALATVSLDVKLTVGKANETVTITTAPPVLETVWMRRLAASWTTRCIRTCRCRWAEAWRASRTSGARLTSST